MDKKIFHFIFGLLFIILFPLQHSEAAIIADHTSVQDFNIIPSEWITQAKSNFRISYGHTSHGSQIVTGMSMVRTENSLYSYNSTGSGGALMITEDMGNYSSAYGAYDLNNPSYIAWNTATRSYLSSHPSINMVMWSWCGGADTTEANINTYLSLMSQLEADYPSIKFIYMTGHLTGTGPTGNLYTRNNQIRNYVNANNKTLFDFADIESYNPDGTYFPNDSDACSWCTTWCSTHTCPTCGDCAHSHCFNCYNKGKAFWYMMARLAGWNGGGSSDITAPDAPSGLTIQ